MLYVSPFKGFSSWEGRSAVANKYWSGARNASDTGCQCSQDGTCAKTPIGNSICNCDTVGAGLIDNGILTDKDSLPVKSLKYGGSITQFSSIKYILGPLVCSGKARVSWHVISSSLIHRVIIKIITKTYAPYFKRSHFHQNKQQLNGKRYKTNLNRCQLNWMKSQIKKNLLLHSEALVSKILVAQVRN